MTLRKNLCEISDIDLKVIRISIHEEKLKLIHNMRKRNPHTRFVVFWVKLRHDEDMSEPLLACTASSAKQRNGQQGEESKVCP